MPNRVRTILLCEDSPQREFFVKLCRELGGREPLRVEMTPSGRGSAEAWVRKRYPREVAALRTRGEERIALVVVTDGDRAGVATRKNALDQSLEQARMDGRRPNERIALCVPTWSIETWLLHLCGVTGINETISYKESYEAAAKRGSVSIKMAFAKWREGNDACTLPSCIDARSELTHADGSDRT